MDCLLSGSGSGGEASLEYTVDEGRELILTIADLSEGDVDATIRISLLRGASVLVNLASVCPAGRRKVFRFDTIHLEGKTVSKVRMAGINAGNGTQLFYGTSDILNGAHGSKTRQEGRITNLSPGSRSEVSPALLIKDDDVDASHGAALGAYDPEAMYYMMSRGLTEAESRKLITLGSMNFVIDSMQDRELAKETEAALEALEI